MGPLMEKIIILVGMFIATICASVIPLSLFGSGQHNQRSASSARRKLILSLCSCFSGGVFFGALFLDLFPDVHEAWDHILDEIERKYKTRIDYPVQGFVTCFGFFVVLIVEQIILEYKERSQNVRQNFRYIIPLRFHEFQIIMCQISCLQH